MKETEAEYGVKVRKERLAVRLERNQMKSITVLASSEKRTFTNMLRLLLDEALEAREKRQ